jgi:predicted PP-loop superfamily ATPase
MGFSINPTTHYLKILFIIKSCTTPEHMEVAERCIDMYDSRGNEFIKYYRSSTDKPIVAHTGEYDHQTAVWILRKKLQTINK